MKYIIENGGEEHAVEVTENEDGTFAVTYDGRELSADFLRSEEPALCSLVLDGRSYELLVTDEDDTVSVITHGRGVDLRVESEREHNARMISGEAGADGPMTITAAMPGIVVSVAVAVGDSVEKGQSVAVLEAMKMENEVRAPGAGVVSAVAVSAGQTVNGGDVLLELEPPAESS